MLETMKRILTMAGKYRHKVASDNYKETTKKIQTQEMLIFPGFFYVR